MAELYELQSPMASVAAEPEERHLSPPDEIRRALEFFAKSSDHTSTISDSLHELPKFDPPTKPLEMKGETKPESSSDKPRAKTTEELTKEFEDAYKKYKTGDTKAFTQFDEDLEKAMTGGNGFGAIVESINKKLPDGVGLAIEDDNNHGPDDFRHFKVHKIVQASGDSTVHPTGFDEKYGAYEELGNPTSVTVIPFSIRRAMEPDVKFLHFD